MPESSSMTRAAPNASVPLVVVGLLAAFAPAFLLGFSRPEPYEVAIMRWMGAAALGLAAIRPWAVQIGDDPARRMRRWNGATVTLTVLYLATTNPLFLMLAFATLAASVLDAVVERAITASEDLLRRLQQEADRA